ncbi:MAG: ATP-binding cassette domain-containing protein, partial [Nostocales cyanobacterium]
MTYSNQAFSEFLAKLPGFEQLSVSERNNLLSQQQALRYRIGQKIISKEKLPDRIAILYEGKVRLLGYDPQTQLPVTLKILEPGAVIGEISLLRQIACETAIASTEIICLTFSTADYLSLLFQNPTFAQDRQNASHVIEIFDVLSPLLAQQANASLNLKEITQELVSQVQINYLLPGKHQVNQLDASRVWFVSGGGTVANFPPGTQIQQTSRNILEVTGTSPARLVGILPEDLSFLDQQRIADTEQPEIELSAEEIDIPYAVNEPVAQSKPQQKTQVDYNLKKFPFFRGKGEVDSTLACFQMLAKHLDDVPLRKEVVKRILSEQIKRQGTISFPVCAYLGELIGLKSQLIEIPSSALTRVPTPALIQYKDSYAVVYAVDDSTFVLGVPSQGIISRRPGQLLQEIATADDNIQAPLKVLLISATQETPQQRFGLSWFLPYLSRYRRVLIEVFVASFFVQLAALANPLVIQLIIDKVIVQNSINTLNVLGVLLLAVGVFEAVLTTLRTYLFVDTTNRIDMGLGSQIIDHLLRLPLRYFEKRPVGELATRINELENIRQFLTGTALTVVLDAVFSLIYIVVMLFYSWQLTLVGLGIIPLFVIVTLISAPTISRQLRTKAERNAVTQSYLVEVMSGIQTVKAQNIELRSRFSWQERYAKFVAAGFKTVITSTLANSTSQFLNKLSALLVLWVGAYLVLQGELSLGELIAFRIISGYVTSPILRLAQLWQNFQQTGLSLERLSDIVDTPQEAEADRDNIPLPAIVGAVKYEGVSFRFAPAGPLQLNNVSLEFPSGQFIGIVGQSGSGKSTMMKLLLRLYNVESGRILVDGYDISKVELYSLRRQIGVVPQDPLLFDGTVQENIA